jgi:hypothetical protein
MIFSSDKTSKVTIQESAVEIESYTQQANHNSLNDLESQSNQTCGIPGVANPVHETVQELLLIEQLPELHCSTFLQFQDLSVKRGHKISM